MLSGAKDTSKTSSGMAGFPLQVRSLKAGDNDSLIQVRGFLHMIECDSTHGVQQRCLAFIFTKECMYIKKGCLMPVKLWFAYSLVCMYM